MVDVIQYPLGLGMRDLVGVGITAFVGRLDAVIKFSKPSECDLMEREKLVYQRLGRDHCGILRYFGAIGNALVLQYASHGSIRQYFIGQQTSIPLSLKLKWVEQLTDVLCFVHSRNVLHGDISCNNVFLDEQLNVKLGDFAGSAMDDLPRLICYETSHELPGQDGISKRSELFALGSTVYEIMTGSKPHSGLSDEEVCVAFTRGGYPDLESLAAFKAIIIGCWTQSYASADEVLNDVKSEGKAQPFTLLLILTIVQLLKVQLHTQL
ncbi:hypothetical protein MMC19_007018 [Ptychographa xylographoides]|nr:hypothetical protein [Ptychographa xylographoides]